MRLVSIKGDRLVRLVVHALQDTWYCMRAMTGAYLHAIAPALLTSVGSDCQTLPNKNGGRDPA